MKKRMNKKMEINKIVVMTQLKRKIRSYIEERGYENFKSGNYALYLVNSMVIVLEDMIETSIKYISKDEVTGLYKITPDIIRIMMKECDRYVYLNKYIRGYNSVVKYYDNVFFNFKNVIENIENRMGERLNLTNETKNIVAYMVTTLQYEITDLSLKIVEYSGLS